MKLLITGGLGFLGANLALAEAERNNNVTILDNFSKKVGVLENRQLVESKGVIILHVDIRNRNDVEQHFKNNHYDVIYHCAAQVAFKRSVENPRLDFEINALGTFNMLEAIRLYNKDAIFISTSTNQVYGPMTDIRIKERETRYVWTDEPYASHGIPETRNLDFLSPYGCSKGAADQYSIDYARVYDLNVVVLRLSGIYGINQYSYEDHGWVSFISDKILKNEKFNRFGNGKQVRDILYISDIIEAFQLSVKHIDKTKGEAFNIGGGINNSLSIIELMNLIEKISGNKEKSIINPARQADKLIYISDIRKAKDYFRWEPKINKVEGIKKMLSWLSGR